MLGRVKRPPKTIKSFMEVIFLEILKDMVAAFLDYFIHFSAGTRIRR
jgi:hypothetical protein